MGKEKTYQREYQLECVLTQSKRPSRRCDLFHSNYLTGRISSFWKDHIFGSHWITSRLMDDKNVWYGEKKEEEI